MINNPLVSIILLTYNRSGYFQEAYESVLAQTFQDIQIIIVDNGSRVKYAPIQEGWHKTIFLPENIGPGPARNMGMEYVIGKYVSFLDDDNVYFPNRIEECVKIFKEIPYITTIHHQSRAIDADGKDMGRMLFGKQQGFKMSRLLRQNYIDCNECMFRASVLPSFDSNLKTLEDWSLLLTLYQAGFQFHYLEKELIKYRIHPNRNCMTESPKYDLESTLYIRKKHGI